MITILLRSPPPLSAVDSTGTGAIDFVLFSKLCIISFEERVKRIPAKQTAK